MSAPSAMVAKTVTMLEMQNDMNCRVDPDWIEKNREWYRAIWIECAELMDHYGGWKWWKASEPDIEQVMLEIVDIWHFGLSMRIPSHGEMEAAASEIASQWEDRTASRGFLQDVEALATEALDNQHFLVNIIPTLLEQIDRDFNALYLSYVGKNVLNFFRQDHGYKDGTYQKQWNGREDNEHLVEIMSDVDAEQTHLKQAIYDALAERYKRAVNL